VFALLGEIFFEVTRTPAARLNSKAWESFRSATGYTYAEHKLVEARPRLQWMATELEKLTLGMSFHVAFVNPKREMDKLRRAAEDHQARTLIYGNGVHRGYFVIESIEETHFQQADDGSYIAIEAKVELHEWVPGVDFDPLAPPRRATPPPGIVQASRAFTGAAGPAGVPSATTGQPFNANQPIGPHNLLPTSAIVQLTQAGAGPGVTYSPAAYSQPGVSGVAGSGPGTPAPGNPSAVSTAAITRAG
jgi:phage protein U